MIYDVVREPVGPAYRRLLDFSLSVCDSGVVVVHANADLAPSCGRVLKALTPFVVEARETREWPGTRLSDGNSEAVTLYRFRICRASMEIAKAAADRISSWQHPELPEDLSLIRASGRPWLTSVAHERYCFFEIGASERESVERALPELGRLVLKAATEHLLPNPEERTNERWLHVLANATDELHELRIAAEAKAFRWFQVDGAEFFTDTDACAAIAKSMEFPDSPSHTLDDLPPYLEDLSWLPGRWYVLCVLNADQFQRNAPDVYHELLVTMFETAAFWWESRVPFHVVLCGGSSLCEVDYDFLSPCFHPLWNLQGDS